MDGDRVVGFLCGSFGCLRSRSIFSERSGGVMIELNLEKLAEGLVWQLKMLAATRRMCITHEMECGWCAEKERKTAELLRSLRKVIEVKGNVLVIR